MSIAKTVQSYHRSYRQLLEVIILLTRWILAKNG
nr:MAG TPA: hypothetical protein [Caudoviricetes sp.]